MRRATLNMVHELFNAEVKQLCGNRFSHKRDDGYCRGGSDTSPVLAQGQRMKIKKPRLRKNGDEVLLEAPSALRNYDVLCEQVKLSRKFPESHLISSMPEIFQHWNLLA